MQSSGGRGLGPEFVAALRGGLLRLLLERVRGDHTLCLEIREDYVNVYYRGGSLLKVSRSGSGFDARFDSNYFAGAAATTLPKAAVGAEADVDAWVKALPGLKDAMDRFFAKHPKEEREIQQLIVRDNKFGSVARQTDFYVCDIEYANAHGRFDVVAVHWPSTPSDRKRDAGHRLVLGEVKQGDGALDGPSGLHAHIVDVNDYLADAANVEAIKADMVTVFNQKRALGLVDCGKDLVSFGDERPLLLLMLVNHDPDSARLGELLRALPPSPHAEIAIATSSWMGYGLYESGMISVEAALGETRTGV